MKKLTVLIVDDEENVRFIIRSVIETAYPVEVYEADDNEAAWHILRRHKIDLITTDIIRPKASGMEFIREVRMDKEYAQVPILVISAAINIENARKIAALSAIILPKPIPLTHLLELIGMAVHMKRDPDISILHVGTELPGLDYKTTIDIETNPGRAALAKDVIAMANYGGGIIAIGVKEVTPGEFDLIGISSERLAKYETSLINRAIRKFMTPPVSVSARRVIDGKKTFVLIDVPSADDEIILVAKQNEEAGIYPGRIYIRTASAESAEVRDPSELRAMINRVTRRYIDNLMKTRR